jgi:hypothetical protein
MRCVDKVAGNASRLVAVALAAAVSAGAAGRADATSLEGCWEGRWQSCTDQFQGKVKARITRCDATHYHCVFTGTAFKIMPYRYTVTLTACCDPETGKIHFKCSRKIPLWGMYWMNGWASGCKFKARYNTDDHVGYFVMRKVSG